MNNEQKNSHLNAFDDAIRDEIIVAFVLSWVYAKRAWQASPFVIFLRTVFDMSSSCVCTCVPEFLKLSGFIHQKWFTRTPKRTLASTYSSFRRGRQRVYKY